jgi:RNA polymerase sigma-70 factor (ECF subfamily)
MIESDEDRALLGRLAGQDQTAMRLLFERHHVRVFRFIVRVVRREAIAEEITNEVFMEVWRQAKSYQGASAPLTWILSIAHNRAVSSLRRKREERLDEEQAQGLPDEAAGPEMTLLTGDKSMLLRKSIEALSDEQRTIVDLVYFQELSVAEVSEVVGIPEGTVKTRLFSARKNLSKLLSAAGVDRGWP